jgi:hypothetical protein
MKRSGLVLVVAGLSGVAVAGCAKHESATTAPATAVSQSAGPGSAAAMVTTTATVEDIDQKTRVVSLRTAEGEEIRFRAGDEIRNLPQVRKGDLVKATYSESILLQLREAEGEKPSVVVREQTERAPLGAKPAASVVRETVLTAKVTAVDRKKQTVTLEGPEGRSVTLKVQDPKNLERAKVGHLVEATYREAVAISVQKPTK